MFGGFRKVVLVFLIGVVLIVNYVSGSDSIYYADSIENEKQISGYYFDEYFYPVSSLELEYNKTAEGEIEPMATCWSCGSGGSETNEGPGPDVNCECDQYEKCKGWYVQSTVYLNGEFTDYCMGNTLREYYINCLSFDTVTYEDKDCDEFNEDIGWEHYCSGSQVKKKMWYKDFSCGSGKCSYVQNTKGDTLVASDGDDNYCDLKESYCSGCSEGESDCDSGECASGLHCSFVSGTDYCCPSSTEWDGDCCTWPGVWDLKCYDGGVYKFDRCGYNQGKYEECWNDYCEAWGDNYCQNGHVYHSRTCYDRGCSGGSCFDNPYPDEQKVQDCGTAGCSGNICCTSNDYYTCDGGDVYYFSSCDVKQGKKEECGDNYCDGWSSNYCEDGHVYRSRTCYNKGCSGDSCTFSSYTDYDKVQDCGTAGCSGSSCCSSHYYSECDDNDIYYYSSCSVKQEKKEECGEDGCDAWGTPYCFDNDVYHSRTCHTRYCSSSSCHDDTSTEEDKSAECGVVGCSDGACNECWDNDNDGYQDDSCGGTDCNDNNVNVNPGATEQCNGIDDNCDDSTDEGFDQDDCEEKCSYTWTGNGGILNCCGDDDNEDPYEATETSCSDGNDNDCDGLTDEAEDPDCQTCTDGEQRDCDNQVGVCAGSQQICDATGHWPGCDYSTIPDYEDPEVSCDNKDNDCDGSTDEDLTAPLCALQDGVCAGATKTCGGVDGWLDCGATNYGANYEDPEVSCDGLDNDCYGSTDEELTAPLNSKQDGVCIGSTQTCTGVGGWADDYSGIVDYEDPEVTCDNKDNDCDASTDEDFTNENCQYVCEENYYVWTNNGGPLNCCGDDDNEDPYEATETSCSDGNDNDCDGLTDENNDPDCWVPPMITILSPVNNTIYQTTSVDLNWTVNEEVDWCAYSLDGGANDTSILISSDWCYQETANISTACGGLDTGKYGCDGTWDATQTCALTYDGDWDTYGKADTGQFNVYAYFNYSKPTNSLSTSLWEVKDDVTRTNLSINAGCWSQTPLQFRARSQDAPDYDSEWYCWNGYSWDTLRYPTTENYIYEEAMWWNISTPSNTTLTSLSEGPHNITIYCNDTSGNMGQSDNVYFTVDINEAPILVQILDITVNETDLVIITVNATDPDNDTLHYYINDSRYTQTNNIFTWQTQEGDRGSYVVNITISDGKFNVSRLVWINILACQEIRDGENITNNIILDSSCIYNLPNGITIGADDLVFDCNDSMINGSGRNEDKTGIYIDERDNITIKNCYIENYKYGIHLNFTNNSLLLNNNLSNHKWAVMLKQSNNNILINNAASNNTYYAFTLFSSSNNNNLTNNIGINSDVGFLLLSSSNSNILINNTAKYNNIGNKAGFLLFTSNYNNKLISNTASNNEKGFWLYDFSNNNLLANNNASINTYGILSGQSSYNNISNNIMLNNTLDGIWLYTSTNNNTLSYNNISNNGKYGAHLTTESSNNKFAYNTLAGNSNNAFYLSTSPANNFIWANDIYNTGIKDLNEANNIYCVDSVGNNYYDGASGPVCNRAPILNPIANLTVNESNLINITVNATDPDSDELYYYINDTRFNKNNNIFTWKTPDSSAGIYIINITVSDYEFNISQLVTITVNDVCIPNWIEINTSCQVNDTKIGYYEDNNSCYEKTNLSSDLIGKPDNNTYECNYCSEDIQGPLSTDWTECNKSDTQSRIKYYLDLNYDTCCAITGLDSDCHIDNGTYDNVTETQGCNYCTSTWENINSSCLINDTFIIGYSYTNDCCAQTELPSDCNTPENTTAYCDYCKPNWVEINTSCRPDNAIIGWYNDANNCYAITGLESDSNPPLNNTYPCDYYGPVLNILSPINNTVYPTTSVDLNWMVNEEVDWCAYSLDGGINKTVTNNIKCWGDNYYNQSNPYNANDAIQIAAGYAHTCILKSNGNVECWGYNYSGESNPYNANDAIQIAAAYAHTCALKSNGNVECWGDNYSGQSNPYNLGDAIQVDTGWGRTCVLKSNGNVECWGDNYSGQSNPYNGSDAIQVSAGAYHTCILKSNGNVECWGDNYSGESDDYLGGDAIQVAARGNTCILKSNGNVECRGYNYSGESDDYLGGDAIQIATGWYHTCAITGLNNTLTSLSEGPHNITMYCNDTAGNMGQSDYVYFTVKINEAFNISLNQGWNLISIPLDLSDKNINSIFTNLNITIFSYNNSWFIPNEIDNKLGYWLKINESKNLTLIGTEIENKTIEFSNGWNLIGHPYLQEKNISDVFDNRTIYSYNQTWSSYIPNRTFNSLRTLKPGYGYWVKKE